MNDPEKACSLDVMRMFRSCSHLLHHRKCPLQGQSRLLVILLEHDGITQRELLDLAKIRSASLSEALCRMESDGWIHQVRERPPEHPHPSDRGWTGGSSPLPEAPARRRGEAVFRAVSGGAPPAAGPAHAASRQLGGKLSAGTGLRRPGGAGG